jgi:hypothetical protein
MPSMDDVHRLEAKGLARAKIRSKRRRVQMIRRRTIRGSLALFALAWAIVFGQLVTGNDPALSRVHGARKLLTSTHRGSRPSRRPRGEGAPLVAPGVPSEEPASGEEAASGEETAPREEAAQSPAPAPAPPVITSAS